MSIIKRCCGWGATLRAASLMRSVLTAPWVSCCSCCPSCAVLQGMLPACLRTDPPTLCSLSKGMAPMRGLALVRPSCCRPAFWPSVSRDTSVGAPSGLYSVLPAGGHTQTHMHSRTQLAAVRENPGFTLHACCLGHATYTRKTSCFTHYVKVEEE
jgi:hypothetical protein